MNIGELNRRVKLQTAARTSDGAGGVTVTWSDTATVWAAIEPVSGREPFVAQQLQGHVTHKVLIRYRSGITHGMRVLLGTRAFDVQAVINSKESNESLTLYCQEVL
jgi:SPP1 family predicted phage head-tail adaptor